KLGTPRLLATLALRLCGLWPVPCGLFRRTTLTVKALFLRTAEQRRKRPLAHARPLAVTGHREPPVPADGRRTPPSRQGRISVPTCPSPTPRQTAPSSGRWLRTPARRS